MNPNTGLTDKVLERTDVLMWWGHMAHDEVQDAVVDTFINVCWVGWASFLHSGHFSKVFKKLMGTSCDLHWREAGELSASGR
jgi:trehalose utilization protein